MHHIKPVEPRLPSPRPLLTILRCPYCGSQLEEVCRIPTVRNRADGDPLVHGVLRCECAEYPVLEEIPILQHTDGLPRVVQLLKEQKTLDALIQAMNVFRIKWAHRTRVHQVRYYLNCRRLARSSHANFEDAVQLVRKPQVFADYLFHRYANPSFLAAVSLLPVLGSFLDRMGATRAFHQPQPRVLDLGCGAGHSSFLIGALYPHVSLTASDQDFVSLYLAKRFLAPTAAYVCTDAEVPSPFPESYFDVVHCLDAFHYFQSKRAIVGELMRVLKPEALWLFPHLHNALQENVTAGIPLSPTHYARCFEFLRLTLFDEADLHQHRGEVWRARRFAVAEAEELRTAQTIALVGGENQCIDDAKPLVWWLGRLGAALTINPIYQGAWQDETLRLQLRWPNERLRDECRTVEAILPQRCNVTKADLERVRQGSAESDDPRVQELISTFVLVPLPANYGRRDLGVGNEPPTF